MQQATGTSLISQPSTTLLLLEKNSTIEKETARRHGRSSWKAYIVLALIPRRRGPERSVWHRSAIQSCWKSPQRALFARQEHSHILGGPAAAPARPIHSAVPWCACSDPICSLSPVDAVWTSTRCLTTFLLYPSSAFSLSPFSSVDFPLILWCTHATTDLQSF